MTGGKVRQYPYFVGLFHTSTPLGNVELSKEWQRVDDWGKVRQYPYFVGLFHTSTPLGNVELSKEWQRVQDWGKTATISLLCQTFPHFQTSEKCRTNEWFSSNRILLFCAQDFGIASGQTLRVATKNCMAWGCFSVKNLVKSSVFGHRMPHFAVIL